MPHPLTHHRSIRIMHSLNINIILATQAVNMALVHLRMSNSSDCRSRLDLFRAKFVWIPRYTMSLVLLSGYPKSIVARRPPSKTPITESDFWTPYPGRKPAFLPLLAMQRQEKGALRKLISFDPSNVLTFNRLGSTISARRTSYRDASMMR